MAAHLIPKFDYYCLFYVVLINAGMRNKEWPAVQFILRGYRVLRDLCMLNSKSDTRMLKIA